MPSTWEQLYQTHGDVLVLYARQFVSAQAEAEDIVHEAFVRLFCKKGFQRHSNPKALLFQAVRWAALDRIKGDSRRHTREVDVAADLFATDAVPFQASEKEDFSNLISKLLSQLPVDQKEVVVLHLWGDLSFREIGEQLDISPHTASSRYRYGVDRLRAESSTILQAHPHPSPPLTAD